MLSHDRAGDPKQKATVVSWGWANQGWWGHGGLARTCSDESAMSEGDRGPAGDVKHEGDGKAVVCERVLLGTASECVLVVGRDAEGKA